MTPLAEADALARVYDILREAARRTTAQTQALADTERETHRPDDDRSTPRQAA